MAVTLGAADRLEAHAIACELLAQCQTDTTIRKALRHKYGISYSAGTAIIRRAEKAIKEAHDESLPERKARHRARVEALFRAAFGAKRYQTCAFLLKQLSEMDGLNEPAQVRVGAVADEWSDRTAEELEYYAVHGRWPAAPLPASGSSPERALPPATADPLAGLH